MTPIASHSDRVYGLDIFRSLAILFVLVGHSFEHSKLAPQIQTFGHLGILGVELFFVLSGFLIGGIILRLIDQNRFHTLPHIADFWKRRWLRTLPLYFVALLAFLRFDYHGRHSLLDYPAYFVFMQSFATKIPEFFELSWSLAIEEHFYLWFPLVLLLWHKLVKRMTLAIVLAAITFVVIALVFRISQPLFTDWNEYNRTVRVAVLSRLDAIMFGVLMAATKHHSARAFGWIRAATPITAAAFVVLCVWWFVNIPWLMTSKTLQVGLFTGQSLLCALLLPWFDGLRRTPSGANFFTVTSQLSYSLYLVHILVIIATNIVLSRIGLFDAVYTNPFILYPLYGTLFYTVAWITYHQIEKPFLALRDGPFSLKKWIQASAFTIAVSAALVFYF